MDHDVDIVDKFRAGEGMHIHLTARDKLKIAREIRIRDAVDAAREREEIRRRLSTRSKI